MPTPFDTAGIEVGRLRPERHWPLHQQRRAFWPRLSEALKNHRVDARYRRLILYYFGFFWIIGWTLWVLLTAPLPLFRLPLTLLSFLVVVGAIVLIWLALDQRQTSLWAAGTAVGLFALFVLAVSVFLRPVMNQPALLWAWGTLFIYLIGALALLVPIWHVDIKPGEIFLIEDRQVKPEGFRLEKRPRPKVDPALLDAVRRAGIPPDRLEKFLDYGGPRFMREELINTVRPQELPMLQAFFQQVDQNQPKVTLRAPAVQKFRLVWNRADVIRVGPINIENLITKEGNTVAIELDFASTYSPFDIREPEARLKLAEWESVEAMKHHHAELLAWKARRAAQHYFVDIPLQSALTDGSIKKFCARLEDELQWAKDVFGITVKQEAVQCRPIIPTEVQQAETQMLASRPNAQAETARLQALLEQVFKYQVPPRLLAGLMMADRGVEKTVQSTLGDMLELPEPTGDQRKTYFQQKYNDQQPKLEGEDTPAPIPGRRSLNIGEELLRQMGNRAEDAEYRPVNPDDKKDK
ncbi:MAG: hypothetical protein HZC41_11700 [Chloroflexi bacterium]|nr:hypothetical protein [Chloroflexota bacterium]